VQFLKNLRISINYQRTLGFDATNPFLGAIGRFKDNPRALMI